MQSAKSFIVSNLSMYDYQNIVQVVGFICLQGMKKYLKLRKLIALEEAYNSEQQENNYVGPTHTALYFYCYKVCLVPDRVANLRKHFILTYEFLHGTFENTCQIPRGCLGYANAEPLGPKNTANAPLPRTDNMSKCPAVAQGRGDGH